MPTGYTAIIEEKPDLTFREYALRCARAFGSCVMQRDESMDAPPRIDPPSDYHLKAGEQANAKLAELRALTTAGARALFEADVERVRKYNEESAVSCTEKKKRYEAMRAAAEAWTPPTAQHEGLRKFMIEQIDICKSDWTPYPMTPPTSVKDWLHDKLESAERDVVYHAEQHAKELTRYEENKAWIEKLYASV
jgi:hypothetical protein